MKFVEREERRGNRYDGSSLDPPKFGRGPNGEVWHLFEHLPVMIERLPRGSCRRRALCLILTAYSIRASLLFDHELMRETIARRAAGASNPANW